MNLDKGAARVAIVIPAFNEEGVISAVVSGVSTYGTTIVVDDGSTDDTEYAARSAGALVISHEVNRGYDYALATGLERAIADNFDFVITVDGDGQHEPERIHDFINELLCGADVVVGIRDRFQRISETVFAGIAKIIWGISDPLCGMKGYRLSKLNAIGDFCSYRSIGTEIVIRAARSGWGVRQLSVKTRDRKDGSRFGAGFLANWLIFRALLLGLLRAKAYPLKPKVFV